MGTIGSWMITRKNDPLFFPKLLFFETVFSSSDVSSLAVFLKLHLINDKCYTTEIMSLSLSPFFSRSKMLINLPPCSLYRILLFSFSLSSIAVFRFFFCLFLIMCILFLFGQHSLKIVSDNHRMTLSWWRFAMQ